MRNVKFSFGPIVCAVLVCAAVFISGCTDDVQKPDDSSFSVNVRSRDAALYFEWTGPSAVELTRIQIQCLSAADTQNRTDGELFETVDIPVSTGSFSYELSPLENNVTYTVLFTAWDDSGNEYSRRLECTPGVYTAEFDNLSAFIYGGTVHISWAFKFGGEEYRDTSVYLAGRNERLTECTVTAVPVYEEIDENVLDETAVYDKYYVCTVDEIPPVEGMKFDLRAVNTEGVESECASVTAERLNLPVVEITMNMDGENFTKFTEKKKLPATLSTYNSGDNTVTAAPLTVKGRGNSSWQNAPKKSYTLKFEKKQPLLGMSAHKSFALIANYFDKTLLRNACAYELGTALFTKMKWNPHTQYAHLFINGVYEGLYLATETNKIDGSRVSIPNIEDCPDTEHFLEYGYILEVNERMDENCNFKTPQNVCFSLKEPDGEDISEELQNLIKEKTCAIEAALYSPDFGDSTSENYYGNFLDIDSFVDWYLVEECAKNPDSDFFSSCYMYFDPASQKFCMGPLWDFDLGFGNIKIDGESGGLKTGSVPGSGTPRGNWLSRLLEDEAFRSAVSARWKEMRPQIEAYFNSADADSGFSQKYARLEPDVRFNFSRWDILGKPVWKCPDGYENRKTYADEITYFTDWIKARTEWLSNELQ